MTARPAARHLIGELVQGPESGLRLEAPVSSHHPQHEAHLRQCLASRCFDGLEGVDHSVGLCFADPLGGGGLHDDDRHAVGDDVVQLTGDGGSLLLDGQS